MYISHVEENSPAALAGIAPGDVLVNMAETDTPDLSSLEAVMEQFRGNTVPLTVSRDGQQYHYHLPLTGETP